MCGMWDWVESIWYDTWRALDADSVGVYTCVGDECLHRFQCPRFS
jgi:hypothetical protein